MSEVDDCLVRVFGYLQETGQWDDTLVIFTSDHGEQLGDHHLLGKIGYFDESFRIPLVIRDPSDAGGRGLVNASFTESIDVMPTIIEWLGGKKPDACDGRSLLPLLTGSKSADGAPNCITNTTSVTFTTRSRRGISVSSRMNAASV